MLDFVAAQARPSAAAGRRRRSGHLLRHGVRAATDPDATTDSDRDAPCAKNIYLGDNCRDGNPTAPIDRHQVHAARCRTASIASRSTTTSRSGGSGLHGAQAQHRPSSTPASRLRDALVDYIRTLPNRCEDPSQFTNIVGTTCKDKQGETFDCTNQCNGDAGFTDCTNRALYPERYDYRSHCVPRARRAGARRPHPNLCGGDLPMKRYDLQRLFAPRLRAVGCTDHRTLATAGQIATLEVQLIDPPADKLGSPQAPVNVKAATFNVIARDASGAVVPKDIDAQVFISFGGVKTGAESACGADDTGTKPIETITLKGGMLMGHKVDLPLAFGSTSVWIDDPASGTTGASPTIYFRNALIPEVQTPPDLDGGQRHLLLAVQRQVPARRQGDRRRAARGDVGVRQRVRRHRHRRLDVQQHLPVRVRQAARAPSSRGACVKSFSGNYSKFVGFTELNFPLFDVDESSALVTLPPPVALIVRRICQRAQDAGLDGVDGDVHGDHLRSDPAQPDERRQHPEDARQLDQVQPVRRRQQRQCDAFSNLAVELPAKVLGPFDPLQVVGKQATFSACCATTRGRTRTSTTTATSISCTTQMPCAKGTCIDGTCYKNAFNFWTITPRRQDDITVAP